MLKKNLNFATTQGILGAITDLTHLTTGFDHGKLQTHF